ncbi:zinc finger domain-containing protein [Cryptosporidium andersoni]|uniref:Zinc finger domain-containing protein n=1 Tax=Cryptosporidium andersoni TaxID=117008 RepID=A0A1J4MD82_9CRYT|nr:zinc finger domain-containing protein [Cryptosporidium andersoni]
MSSDSPPFTSSSSPSLCSNNCGFYGNSTTKNLCSKCYKDALARDKVKNLEKSEDDLRRTSEVRSQRECTQDEISGHLKVGSMSQAEDISSQSASGNIGINNDSEVTDVRLLEHAERGTLKSGKSVNPSRCYLCNRKVGLLGFQCRCGFNFCGDHRYADSHNCEFDYKTYEREQLRKAHKSIVAEKIQKI